MRRLTGLLTLTILIGTVTMQIATAGPAPNAPCLHHSWIPRTMGPVEHDARLDALIDCATARWWPGNAGTVAAIIDRESGGNPFATNPDVPGACVTYGSCGLGQHLIRYWPGRATAYLRAAWFRSWPARWWNARANVIVTVRMMAAQGGVCPAWC